MQGFARRAWSMMILLATAVLVYLVQYIDANRTSIAHRPRAVAVVARTLRRARKYVNRYPPVPRMRASSRAYKWPNGGEHQEWLGAVQRLREITYIVYCLSPPRFFAAVIHAVLVRFKINPDI